MKEKRDKQQGPLPFIESKTLWNGLRGRRGGGGSPSQTAQVYGRPSLFLKVAQVHSDEPNHTLSSIAQALRCSGCSSPKEARGRLEHRQRWGPHAHLPLATPSGQYHGAPVSNLALLHLHFSCPYPVRQDVAF